MSIVYTEITLKNLYDVRKKSEGLIGENEVRQMTVKATVDTGAWTLVINGETRQKLGLDIVGSNTATLADGKESRYDMTGPLEVWWKDRRVILDALLLPESREILLGAIPMEAMDLTVNPKRELVGAHGDKIMHVVY